MEPLKINRSRQRQCFRAGFSLVELLVVIAVIAVVMAFSMASFSTFSGATLLKRTGDHLIGFLAQARQDAIAGNSHVEVRFYQPRDLDAFDPQWSVLTVRENQDGTHRAVGSPYHFPDGLILNQSEALSSLIGGLVKQPDTENLITASSSEPRFYTSFRFYSNGSTNLPVTSNGDTWHITLMVSNNGNGSEPEPPSNFFTIKVDPFTGTVRTFRP
jgi:uncharacterized protein (TIGR02596 family)